MIQLPSLLHKQTKIHHHCLFYLPFCNVHSTIYLSTYPSNHPCCGHRKRLQRRIYIVVREKKEITHDLGFTHCQPDTGCDDVSVQFPNNNLLCLVHQRGKIFKNFFIFKIMSFLSHRFINHAKA